MYGTREKVEAARAGAGTPDPITGNEVSQATGKLILELKEQLLEQIRTNQKEALPPTRNSVRY